MTRDTTAVRTERQLRPDAKQIDHALRSLAQQHAALDADEAHWLRVADRLNVWPALGYVHAFEYLEDVFGYAPRTAKERLRVARELGALPQLEDALRVGELSYSVVRELTRVATPETVERWLDEARGRRFRDVEQIVAGRRKGDEPDSEPDPKLVKRRIVLELDGESFALWRHMQAVVEQERAQKLDDRELVLAIGGRVVRELGAGTTTNQAALDPQYLIQRISTCSGCERAWQDAGGVRVEVGRAARELAECNAIVCDDEHGKRAKRTVPKKTVRLALERAQHRCQVPGCRSSKHLAIHHIVFRSQGGTNALSNLIVLCDGHHRVLHDGMLTITGRAPNELVFTRNGVPLRALTDSAFVSARTLGDEHARHALSKHGARSVAQRPRTRASMTPALHDSARSLADQALRQLGFKAPIAARAVDAACEIVGENAELGALIKEALRHAATCG